MSKPYKPKGSPYYHYDFQMRGRRFHGSTQAKTLKAARLVEERKRKEAEQILVEAERLRDGPLTMLSATSRYWQEIGQHHAGAATTWTNLQRLLEYFGADTRLVDIRDDEMARMVAWRRGQRAWNDEKAPLLAPATVNRSTTEVMKKLFKRARRWGADFPDEPEWKAHFLKEPKEHTRELRPAEETRIDDEMREDLEPFFAFARASGLRLSECFLTWENVDWHAGVIETIGKGNRPVRTLITADIRTILLPLRQHHPQKVFTYTVQRTVRTKGLVQGDRRPLTYEGLKSYWRRMKKRAGMVDFRFHDFRHDFGTKLLRETGNLKMVQIALNHQDIKTTTRYAHVLDEDLRAGLERLSKSRKKSRTGKQKLKVV